MHVLKVLSHRVVPKSKLVLLSIDLVHKVTEGLQSLVLIELLVVSKVVACHIDETRAGPVCEIENEGHISV